MKTAELEVFYQGLTDVYTAWIKLQSLHRRQRDASIRDATFPFQQLREGQERLLGRSREALQRRNTLLAEAPTGIGKTVSVLYAAVRQLPIAGDKLRLAYLTAKTTGHASAKKAVTDLQGTGVRLNALAFAARERLCFGPAGGGPCEVETCPYAQHYFDRRLEALREARELGWTGLEELRELGEKHGVCPSALALDLAPWVDLVVCDYNYVFDPSVRLAALSNEGSRQMALLIDEAHNLPDRARRMFSAEIATPPLVKLQRALGKESPEIGGFIDRLLAILAKAYPAEGALQPETTLETFPKGLRSTIGAFLVAVDRLLSRGAATLFHEELLEVYFELSRFLRLAEMGRPETHVLVLGPATRARSRSTKKKPGLRLRWLCLDPSPLLQNVYRETGPVIAFSATLSPVTYFARLLGKPPESARLRLSSPFPREHFGLMIHTGVATTYRQRDRSYAPLAKILATFALGRPGHYLAYFSSYEYLHKVEEELRASLPKGLRVLSQAPDMDLAERYAFLKQFRVPRSPKSRTSLLGLAVLGGVFGEGVDLVGENLIGVAVVGVGLPQVNFENDLIKQRFADLEGDEDESLGFDFAYTYPGFSRVLQAVGRLIRTESDRGLALLIDQRYREHRYRDLFPEWWEPNVVRSLADIAAFQEGFWKPS